MRKYLYEDGLETQRLSTRFLKTEDSSLWTSFFKDPESVEFFPNTEGLSPEERAATWIEKQINRYQDEKYGLQALIDKSNGEFIGQCGLLLQEVDGKEELEVGYHIFKEYRGKGFAPEAARLFLEYGFKNDLAESIISIIHRDNIKSQKVADKNGLKAENETSWRDLPIIVYRISKGDFQMRAS